MAEASLAESVQLPYGDRRINCDDRSLLHCVAHLVVWKKDCQSNGTGFLVKHGNDLFILTAAHNIYDIANGEKAREVSVSFGRNIESYPHGKMSKTATEIEVPEEFNDGNSEYDVGIIYLDEMDYKYRSLGYFSIHNPDQKVILNKDKFMNGYPDPAGVDVQGGAQMKIKLSEVYTGDKYLYYPDATSVGNSGSPVYIVHQKETIAIGVHISGFLEQRGKNMAIRISDDVLRVICRLVQRAKHNVQSGVFRQRNMWQFQSLPTERMKSRHGITYKAKSRTERTKSQPVKQEITQMVAVHERGKSMPLTQKDMEQLRKISEQPQTTVTNTEIAEELLSDESDVLFQTRNWHMVKSLLVASKETLEKSIEETKESQAVQCTDIQQIIQESEYGQSRSQLQHQFRVRSESCLELWQAESYGQQTNVQASLDILLHPTSFVFMPVLKENKFERFQDIEGRYIQNEGITILPPAVRMPVLRSTFVDRVKELATEGVIIYTHSLCGLLDISIDVKCNRQIKYEGFYAVPGYPPTLLCVTDKGNHEKTQVWHYSRCLAAKVVHSLRQFTDEYISAISGVLTEEDLQPCSFAMKVQEMFDSASRFCISESLYTDKDKCHSITRACLMAIAVAASRTRSETSELVVATGKELEEHFRKHSVYALPVLSDGDRRDVTEASPMVSVAMTDDVGIYPFSCLAFLRSNISGEWHERTGFVVKYGDERFILTAASNVYDLKKKQKATEIEIFIPTKENTSISWTKKGSDIKISKQFRQKQHDHDFAAVRLEADDFQTENAFEIPNIQHRGIQTKLRFKTAGFMKPSGSSYWSIYEIDHKLAATERKHTWHYTNIRTINGSPVYFLDDDMAVLAGIHLQYQDDFGSHTITYLSEEVVSAIKDMVTPKLNWKRSLKTLGKK